MLGRGAEPVIVRNEKLVVLIVPEALSGLADPALLRETLVRSSAPIRVLLCFTEATDHALAAAVTGFGVETQILLAPEVDAPATSAFILRAPAGTKASDQQEFALALSDVVVVATASAEGKFISLAKDLGKPLVVAGAALPALATLVSVTDRLDPDVRGWHARVRCIAGRFEQAFMELLAYNWHGGKDGPAKSREKLRRCISSGWRPRPYFAPDGCRALAPDRTIDETSKIAVCFDALDRSALYGSYIHRDFAWLEHLGAAFAVFAAIIGYLLHSGWRWGMTEFVTLWWVAALVIIARRMDLQDRWTACRLGAEQLRIARMSLPLLVLPSALATSDKPPTPPSGGGHGKTEIDFGFNALAEVKRAVRDQGLPRPVSGFSPAQAAAWVHLIVSDQLEYHRRNYQKLEHAEQQLRLVTAVIFFIAIFAVAAHLVFRSFHFIFPYEEWLLLFTAAFPALAAALHGAGTRLGIVHRAALSRDMERQLAKIDNELVALSQPGMDEAAAWREVRHQTFEAAKAMGQENTSWHGLVRRYRDDL